MQLQVVLSTKSSLTWHIFFEPGSSDILAFVLSQNPLNFVVVHQTGLFCIVDSVDSAKYDTVNIPISVEFIAYHVWLVLIRRRMLFHHVGLENIAASTGEVFQHHVG